MTLPFRTIPSGANAYAPRGIIHAGSVIHAHTYVSNKTNSFHSALFSTRSSDAGGKASAGGRSASPEADDEPAGPPTFHSLGLGSHLSGKLPGLGFHMPSEVQATAIPLLLEGASPEDNGFPVRQHSPPNKDIALHAQTGSGKTLAYLLPIFSRLDPKTVSIGRTKAIIVTPTRELSHQVRLVADLLGKPGNKKGLDRRVRVMRAVGEVSAQQLAEVRGAPPHVLIGTPQALAKLVPESINTGELQFLVLDEADELVRPHNMAAVTHLVKHAAKMKTRPSVVAVSAASSPALNAFLSEHTRIRPGKAVSSGIPGVGKLLPPVSSMQSCARVDLTRGRMVVPPGISHYAVALPHPTAAYRHVTRLLSATTPRALLVFHNSAASMAGLQAYLAEKNVRVGVLGNAQTNKERTSALNALSAGRLQVLLSTEMASRGLDFGPRLTHVLNFDPPATPREYLHRAGRVGRIGSAPAHVHPAAVRAAACKDAAARGTVDVQAEGEEEDVDFATSAASGGDVRPESASESAGEPEGGRTTESEEEAMGASLSELEEEADTALAKPPARKREPPAAGGGSVFTWCYSEDDLASVVAHATECGVIGLQEARFESGALLARPLDVATVLADAEARAKAAAVEEAAATAASRRAAAKVAEVEKERALSGLAASPSPATDSAAVAATDASPAGVDGASTSELASGPSLPSISEPEPEEAVPVRKDKPVAADQGRGRGRSKPRRAPMNVEGTGTGTGHQSALAQS